MFLYEKHPKNKEWGFWNSSCIFYHLDSRHFPEVKWKDDEPTEVELKIIKKITIMENKNITADYIRKKVVVCGNKSGLFFGTLEERNGQEVKLTDVRRLWY